jgi:replicative DNA helicase
MVQKIIPDHLINEDLDKAFLGNLIIYPTRFDVWEKIKKQYFASDIGKELYPFFQMAFSNDQNFEIATLVQFGANKESLLECIRFSGDMTSFENGLVLLYQNYINREIFITGMSIVSLQKKNPEIGGLMKEIELLVEDFNTKVSAKTVNLWKINDLINEQFSYWAEKNLSENSGSFNLGIPGLTSYFVAKGHLACVVARTKSGKTTFLCQTALKALHEKRPVLFMSLEINQNELLNKILAIKAKVNPLATENFGAVGKGSSTQTSLITQNMDLLNEQELYIYHSSEPTMNELKHKIKEFVANNKNGVVLIDQLQFILANKEFFSKTQEYDYILRKIKQWALQFNVPIFLAHQMNRDIEKRDQKYPQTSDIKDSGRVEEISDLLIMFAISTNSKEKDLTRYCTIVSRHQKGGRFELYWDEKLAQFE